MIMTGSEDVMLPPKHPLTRKSVILFIAAVIITVVGVTTAAVFFFSSSQHQASIVQHQVSAASQQWCTALDLLTKTPVPKPAAPGANPSRENGYELYVAFMKLRGQFGCA